MSVAKFGANAAHLFFLASAVAALITSPVFAQAQGDAALDPLSPMDGMPGLGVDWPDLAAPDIAGVPPPVERSADSDARRYSFTIDGLAGADRAELLSRFNLLSALREGEGKPANAAQIDKRAREDSDLLNSILRAAGYYDADVEARVETGADNALTVTLTADPGQLYRFGDVQLTGLDGTDPNQRDLRAGFNVGEADGAA
jgi:translocation and assembly module TamA